MNKKKRKANIYIYVKRDKVAKMKEYIIVR